MLPLTVAVGGAGAAAVGSRVMVTTAPFAPNQVVGTCPDAATAMSCLPTSEASLRTTRPVASVVPESVPAATLAPAIGCFVRESSTNTLSSPFTAPWPTPPPAAG